MTTETLQAVQSATIKSAYPTTNYSTGDEAPIGKLNDQEDIFLISFAAPAAENVYKNVASAAFSLFESGSSTFAKIDILDASFIENVVTWNSRPAMEPGIDIDTINYSTPRQIGGTVAADRLAALVVKNGAAVRARFNGSLTAYTSRSAHKPKITVHYDDITVGPRIDGRYPTAGYVNPTEDLTVRWQTVPNGFCFGDVSQISAVLSWRIVGGSTTTINLTTEQSYTIPAPAGGFGSGGIEWKIAVTANNGLTSSTPWYTLQTADSNPTVTALSPGDTMVDANKPVTFEWNYDIATGTAQTAAEIDASSDGLTWSTIGTVSGSAHSWTAQANSLPSGTLYWTVRAANSDGVYSEWADYLTLAVVGAPAAPTVSASMPPQSTIMWQATGQEAAEVAVDGVSAPIIWGPQKTYLWPEILADGVHTYAVRVCNSYGLWSDWGFFTQTITNIPGLTISAGAIASVESVVITWTPNGCDEYQILRDGAVIGTVTAAAASSFEDEIAGAGYHVYQIRGLSGGWYALSDQMTVLVIIDGIMLKPEGGEWINLTMTQANPQTITEKFDRAASLVYYSGIVLPEVETSGQITHVYSFRPALTAAMADTADKLLRAAGKTVWLKDMHGTSFGGLLSAVPRERTPHHMTFDISITEVQK